MRNVPSQHEQKAMQTQERAFSERLLAGGVLRWCYTRGDSGSDFARRVLAECPPEYVLDARSKILLQAVSKAAEKGGKVDLIDVTEAVRALSLGDSLAVRQDEIAQIALDAAEFFISGESVVRHAAKVAEEWRKEEAGMQLAAALDAVKTVGAPIELCLEAIDQAASVLGRSSTGGKSRVSAWVESSSGMFSVSDLYRDIGVKTPEEREKCRKEISSLLASGAIEKTGARDGQYRRRERDLAPVDLKAPEQPRVDMWLPFGLHRDVIIQPKNIIVIAGETNSGKTGCLFNFCHMNPTLPIRYLTSEMPPNEINSRIASFHSPRAEWDAHVSFFERAGGFHDAIDPDGVTIIDFLEVHDSFYAVGAEIKKIHDALRGGVVFIALQKRTGELFGRGGEFTLEKARLGLSLFTHGRLPDGIIGSAKVTKAKNIIPGRNPEGKEQFYTLRGGYHYDNTPVSMVDFQRGWRFYPKKDRDRVLGQIERHCKRVQDTTMADEIEGFYAR